MDCGLFPVLPPRIVAIVMSGATPDTIVYATAAGCLCRPGDSDDLWDTLAEDGGPQCAPSIASGR